MATCNVDGLLRQYIGSAFNGSAPSHSGSVREHVEYIDIKGTKYISTMAPRIVMEQNLVPAIPNGPSVDSDALSKETCESTASQPTLPTSCTSNTWSPYKLPGAIHTAKPSTRPDQLRTTGHSNLELRRIMYKRRLETCTKRLESLRDKSLALLTRLLANQLPKVAVNGGNQKMQLPESLCRLLDEEETESDSDEEPNLQSKGSSSLEENWLCTRSVSCSDWHWLVSEIRRSDKCIKNLRLLRSSLQKWKSSLTLHHPEINIEESCSRVVPFVPRDRKRHSYHDLASPKCARLLGELSKQSIDPCVRCSCVPYHTGPCILCCGTFASTWVSSRDRPQCVDLLHAARPLGAHIHPKLSFPGDVQLSLRLESRLSTAASSTFREPKSTLHPITEDDRPCCLKAPRNKMHNRLCRVNGFQSLRKEHRVNLVANRYQDSPHTSNQQASSSTTMCPTRPTAVPFRTHSKTVSTPSALRRILNLAPDSDNNSDVLREQRRDCNTH